MVELVADDQVVLAGDGRDDAAVGGEAGLVGQHGLGVLEGRQPPLQLLVELHRAGDRPDGAAADAQVTDGGQGRLDQMRMGGQAQVVVGGEADDRPTVHDRVRRLPSVEDPHRAVEGLGAQVVDLVVEVGEGIGSGAHRHA